MWLSRCQYVSWTEHNTHTHTHCWAACVLTTPGRRTDSCLVEDRESFRVSLTWSPREPVHTIITSRGHYLPLQGEACPPSIMRLVSYPKYQPAGDNRNNLTSTCSSEKQIGDISMRIQRIRLCSYCFFWSMIGIQRSASRREGKIYLQETKE